MIAPAPIHRPPQPYRSWERDGWIFTHGGGPGVTILMYHKVGAPLAGSRLHDLYVSARDLDRQLSELTAAGQRAIPYGESPDAIGAGETGFCLSFDDASPTSSTTPCRSSPRTGRARCFSSSRA